MNISNRLTLFRMVIIPVIVLIYLFPYAQFGINVPYWQFDTISLSLVNVVVLVLFCLGALTDFLDGYLARKNDWVTNFGKFLDPIADKLLVNTLFILFASQRLIPIVAVIIMIWRDTIVDGIRMLIASQGIVLAAGYLGKIKTVVQIAAVISVLSANLPFELYNIPVSTYLVWFATFISVISGISYLLQTADVVLKQ